MVEFILVHLPLANGTAYMAFGRLPTCLRPSLFGHQRVCSLQLVGAWRTNRGCLARTE